MRSSEVFATELPAPVTSLDPLATLRYAVARFAQSASLTKRSWRCARNALSRAKRATGSHTSSSAQSLVSPRARSYAVCHSCVCLARGSIQRRLHHSPILDERKSTHMASAVRSALSLTTEFALPHASYAAKAFLVMPRYRFRYFCTSPKASTSALLDRGGLPAGTALSSPSSSDSPLSEDSNRMSSVCVTSPAGAMKG